VAQSDDHRRLMEDAGYNSAAVVGLVARGRVLGALSFLHVAADLRYDSGDLDFLNELGDRAAIALDNARLYEERDQIAADLQRGLRPPEPPYIPGLDLSVVFEAAGGTEIGGDFYDVLPAEDGCWLLIGDVAGKGSSAAAVPVGVRHAVRGLSRELSDPVAVLGRVNELLREGSSLNDFASAQLIRLSRRGQDWELELAAAGHPPAVRISATDTAQLGGGTLLGAWEEPRLERHAATLGAGESLVLSTDGWFEAGPARAHRGPDHLAEVARSCADVDLAQMTECLRADAISRGEGTLRDDMIVFAVRAADE
jgi:serine phosphatase RsbU (regulator of sigma subunit)